LIKKLLAVILPNTSSVRIAAQHFFNLHQPYI
jgi:hypothetical protein